MSDGPDPARTLAGIRVVEVAQNLAGPWCARILAGLGAGVVKVEPPEGDAARAWGPPFQSGQGTIFALANPDKRVVRLDLTDARGMESLRRLVAEADVLVQSLRPGALDDLGLGWDEARALNPRLIYASVLAYGEEGPLASLPGYEPLMQAHGGIMWCTGEPGRDPVRVGTSVVDMSTGMWTALAVLAALRERERTGRGSRVSASLFDTALALSGYHLLGALGGAVAGRHGTELPLICPYGAFPTRDAPVMVAVGSDALFQRLCRALGLHQAAADPRFAHNPDRVAHRAELNEAVAARTAELSSSELLDRLREAGVPCAPILDMPGVLAEPQTDAAGMLTQAEDEVGRARATVALPLRFDGRRPGVRRPSAEPGSHTEAVLRELGYDDEAIAELRRDGVLGPPAEDHLVSRSPKGEP